MALPFPFPLQQAAPPLTSTIVRPTPINYMATGMGFSTNGINSTLPSIFFIVNSSIVASGMMTRPLHVHAETSTNVPSTSLYMNMVNAFAPAYDDGGATDNNIAAAPGQRVAMEEDHILPEEVAEIASSMMHAHDTTNADDNIGVHQQQIDFDDGHQEQQNQVDGSLDVVVASADAANSAGGDDYDVSWDEFVIPDDSFMSTFWEEIMMEDNPTTTLLPDATTSADLRALAARKTSRDPVMNLISLMTTCLQVKYKQQQAHRRLKHNHEKDASTLGVGQLHECCLGRIKNAFAL
jgi:hypothetical protein